MINEHARRLGKHISDNDNGNDPCPGFPEYKRQLYDICTHSDDEHNEYSKLGVIENHQ